MTTAAKSGAGYPGQMGLWGATSDFNGSTFIVQQLLALVRTATLVQVQKCTNAGGVEPVGTVDVLPLVNMIDGIGTAFKHGTVYKLPYARLQGGKNAIICDPVVGDIGVAVFADRDISVVKKTKKQSNPGSRRKHNMADGVYLFGVLNAAPTQYVRFLQDEDGEPNGIEIIDKFENKIEMGEDGIRINGVLIDRDANISEAAKIDATDEITAKSGSGDSVTVTGHTHPGVQTGGGNTDPPEGGT